MPSKKKKEKPIKPLEMSLEDSLRIGLAGPLAMANPGSGAREIAAKIEDQVEAIMKARKE